MTKIAGSGSESRSISQRHGSADPDPHQNVMDPEHWPVSMFILLAYSEEKNFTRYFRKTI
jgi:hypothetical protein